MTLQSITLQPRTDMAPGSREFFPVTWRRQEVAGTRRDFRAIGRTRSRGEATIVDVAIQHGLVLIADNFPMPELRRFPVSSPT